MHAVKENGHADIEQLARQAFQAEGEKIGALLEPYEIPDAKLPRVLDYAIGMKAHNPKMKNHRVVRKTVEFFKLKLKSNEESKN